MSKKISIRFLNDREVRAVWDDENNCWWYSATNVVRAINDEQDYTKAVNYWHWLKRKPKAGDIQFVCGTHKLKFVAADEKQYNSDAIPIKDIAFLAKRYPDNHATKFPYWFLYNDNPITEPATLPQTVLGKADTSFYTIGQNLLQQLILS